MSILYIDHKETFLENTQRAFINEGRYTFGSVKLPLIEIDEAINGPDTTVTQLVPVEEESAQQESKLCRHSPPKVTDIHNNPDENVNGIGSSEWSNQTAIVPAADRIESQGCNDGGVSISDESTLQGPLICRANKHPNAQVVDEGPQSSEWSNTVASAPSPGHVDSEHNDDHRMPIYEETSLQIRTRNNTDGVDTSLSSSDSSPAHVNSPHHGDGKMPIYEETSLQIKTCSNTDDVDTSLPSSEWASQTSMAPSAGHMNSQPCGYGGMPAYKETFPRISKTRDEGNKTSQSSDWSDKSVNDPSAGLMMSPHYGAGGMSTNDGSEGQRIVFDSPSDKTRGNTQDAIIPVNTRVLHSRRPYQWHRMPVEIRQGDGSLPCHVCQSLLPLLDRINCQLRELESQEPLPNEDGGLQRDMDRVFESLYAAIDQREEELLASFGDHSPHSGRGDTDLASLLAHLENTKSYCDKTLVYTTKPELLSLTGMIHTRAEELLSQDIADPVPPSDVMFRDDGLPDLVQEIENFGKVFNEKDVDAAVKGKTFPKEHKLSESDIILEQRRSSLQSMPPMRRASMPPEDGRDFNSMPQITMLDPNTQSVPPRRGSRDVDFNGYTGGKDVEGLPPHDPYSRDGLNGPDRRGQGGYPYQQNIPVQSPDDRRYDHRGNQYDPQTRVAGSIYQNPVDRRYEPSGNPYDPETRNADPMYQNPEDGRYDARGNPHGPQTRDTANGSPGNYPQGQIPHSRYPNDRNQPNGGPLDCDVITPDQAPQQRSAPDSYDEAPRLDPTEDRTAPNEAGMFPGSSALAVYVHAHHQKLRENDDDPVTKDTMIYSITPEPDSDRDAVLSVSPKLFQPEHTIKCVYMEFDKGTVYEENHVTHDGKLVNDPPNLPSPSASWRFKNYKGALSTRPLDGTGMSYLEFWTDIEIKQIHGGRSLIFEAAVADRDVIDLHHKAEDQSHAWGVSLSNCPEHDGLCRRTWGAGQSLKHYPHTLPNQPDSKARLRFGFFIMQKQKKLVVIDCNEEKVLLTADNIKISRPLWPVFGVYNTDLSHVETALVSGTNLKMDRNIAWLILQNI
ncbi:uncharacterized protein [Haliotis cracherodii]|uniref:uncharacterized protein isoform X1 n=2 Tax=Haliotis cracherodii TaxID=6455 RepID=UPI0039EAD07D